MNEIEHSAGLAPTPGYRYADEVGDTLFVAGQVPHDSAGDVIGLGNVAAQATACVSNLFTLVESHGFLRTDIHHLTIYVVGSQADLGDVWRAVVNEFGSEVPPATLLGVNLLGHGGQCVEIDARVQRGSH